MHCDVHSAAENKHTLPLCGSLDSFWIMRSQRSRRRDKGLYLLVFLPVQVSILYSPLFLSQDPCTFFSICQLHLPHYPVVVCSIVGFISLSRLGALTDRYEYFFCPECYVPTSVSPWSRLLGSSCHGFTYFSVGIANIFLELQALNLFI